MKALNNIIVKLELKRQGNIDLDISKEEFFVGLKKKVRSESESPLFSGFEIFSSDDTPFFGEVTDKGFTLRSRRIAGKSVRHLAVAKGIIKESDKGLSVLIEINAFRGRHKLLLMFLVPLYVFSFLGCLYVGVFRGQLDALLGLIFLPFHAALTIGVLVFLLSKAARILDQILEHSIKNLKASDSTN
jgi:hypothetical protein